MPRIGIGIFFGQMRIRGMTLFVLLNDEGEVFVSDTGEALVLTNGDVNRIEGALQ